jgi:hypothetical protein
MNKNLDCQLSLMLREWKDALIEGSFVTDIELSVLKRKIELFIERQMTHVDDDHVGEMLRNDSHGG